MSPINYYYLAQKYFSAEVVLQDRTYEGLEWNGPGEKPSKKVFESLHHEEQRAARVAGKKIEAEASAIQEKQHQAREKAKLDAIPLEEKIHEAEDKVRQEIFAQRLEAKSIQELIATNQELVLCWYEISKAQEKINDEAEGFLKDSEKELRRLKALGEEPSEELLKKRKEAAKRIKLGELVYKHWDLLRAKEMPTREEIQTAIKEGGNALKRMKEYCNGIALKYPKTKIRG